jgi:hypothetical protein
VEAVAATQPIMEQARQVTETFAAQAFGAAADREIIVRPLPSRNGARGDAAVAALRLVAPTRPATADR